MKLTMNELSVLDAIVMAAELSGGAKDLVECSDIPTKGGCDLSQHQIAGTIRSLIAKSLIVTDYSNWLHKKVAVAVTELGYKELISEIEPYKIQQIDNAMLANAF